MCVLVNWVLLSVIVIDAAFATTASPDLGHAFTVECDHFCSCDHNDVESQDFIPFFHETCEVRNLTGLDYKPCYKIPGYFDHEGKVKVFVKFKGDSDGHVRLEDDSGHGYEIVFGSWHNMHSEIRTIHDDETQDRMKVLLQTPRILSPDEFKSFYVEYDKSEAKLETFEGGRASKLVSWVDKESFDLRYVSFSGFHSDKTIQVAFNCTATDNRSTIYLLGTVQDLYFLTISYFYSTVLASVRLNEPNPSKLGANFMDTVIVMSAPYVIMRDRVRILYFLAGAS